MFKNYMKLLYRNFMRQKVYSLINILGLSLGMALFILVFLYVYFEFSFDKFHTNYKTIYRVEENLDGRGRLMAFSHIPLGPKLVEDFPEFKEYTRFLNMGAGQLLSVDNIKFSENGGWWAEPSFLDFFSYRLIRGDSKIALSEPFSIILSRTLAEKYFPNEDAMGQTIRLNNVQDYQVTGIIENCPSNSHIQYNFLISYNSCKTTIASDYFESWNQIANYTYVRLSSTIVLDDVNSKIKDILRKTLWETHPSHVYLKPMAQFHFHSNVIGEIGRGGDLNTITIFSAIGIFILFIACINYMNLATARSSKRMKEIGLRKVTGATRQNLIRQFLGESTLLSFTGLAIAFLWVALFLPEFRDIVQRNLPLKLMGNPLILICLVTITLATGIISGSYPAFFMSSFSTAEVLKGTLKTRSVHRIIRKILVVFQFMLSIILITGTLIIQRQMRFIQNKDLGIKKDHMLVMDFSRMDKETLNKYDVFKTELLNYPFVENVSVSRHLPTNFGYSANIINEWEDKTEDTEGVFTYLNFVDQDFLKTYGITLIAGRDFVASDFQNESSACIINETAAKKFGWENGIGKRIGRDDRVIGVVKDFHFSTLRDEIAPLIFHAIGEPPPGTRARHHLSVRLSPQRADETMNYVKQKFQELFPDDIFGYRFFEDDLDQMYQTEKRFGKTIAYFSTLAIFIACLGLFGLAAFTAEQRTKEIGVRKVVGASVPHIVYLLSLEFTKWVLLANIFAWPAAYIVIKKWLQGFAYRINIQLWVFGLSAIIAFVIALLTVSYQAINAALKNPVTSLKYE